jgi:membrane glycosyltransferase
MTRISPISPAPEMPPEAPLAMPEQDLSRGFRDPAAPAWSNPGRVAVWRLMTFLPAIAATAMVVALFTDFFRMDGFSTFETVLLGLIAFSFFWIALTVSTALVGLVSMSLGGRDKARTGAPMDVALVVPMHAENPVNVVGNACAMLDALRDLGSSHRFDLFLLSDTKDPDLIAEELRIFSELRLARPDDPVFYRSYTDNAERKIGNLKQWITGWGAAYEAMIVLDADSLMSAQSIVALSDAMAADPATGLIQSAPRIHGSLSVFGRVQQFGSAVYGGLLGAGLAAWVGGDGNYWGHNAIIRTRAFAASACLPRIGRRKTTMIFSHDFVEAALIRRAGWKVGVLTGLSGSYEEAPQNIIDFVLRDRRWCRGNLQHLRLLAVPGLHPASRFHMFQGAMSYLVSPVWLALLFVWAAIGVGEEKSLIVYFSGTDPRPDWPEMTGPRQLAFLAFMYGMLLAPKIIGAMALPLSGVRLGDLGGGARLVGSMLTEIATSVAYAPILMVQQTGAILRSLVGSGNGWTPSRGAAAYSWADLAKFHIFETVIGVVLTAGLLGGYVTLWLIPIAASLLMAVPLSRLSGLTVGRGFLGTEDQFRKPEIVQAAHARRAELAMAPVSVPMAAE